MLYYQGRQYHPKLGVVLFSPMFLPSFPFIPFSPIPIIHLGVLGHCGGAVRFPSGGCVGILAGSTLNVFKLGSSGW